MTRYLRRFRRLECGAANRGRAHDGHQPSVHYGSAPARSAGGTFSASTGLWPIAGLCMTIRAVHHDYWRKVREGENANEGKATTELCRWSRPCLASCGKGCSEDCAHVRHAALRVGKRQGRGEEAVRLCHRQPPATQSSDSLCWYFCWYQYSGINSKPNKSVI